MKIDQNTGQITWNNLTSSDAGKHEVTVKVKDNRGAVDTQTYTLEVSNVVPGQLQGKVYLDDRQPLNTLVYFNDFEDPNRSKSEWSNPITDVTPIGNRHFLGQYSSISKNNPRGKTSLDLNSLPEHDTVTVSFDLYILKSWDGNANWLGGPALWELNVENGPTLLKTTFSNVDFYWSWWGVGQSYPDTYSPTSNYPPHTGAVEKNTLGYSFYGDSTYNLSFTFDHKDSSLLLNFLGNAGNGGLADIGNESWGLDNVEVRTSSKGHGLSNWPVYLDSNGNNKRDLLEKFTLTNEQGNYSFTLDPGNYTVAQELPTGWTQVAPTGNTYQVSLASNQQVKNLDFGNTNAVLPNVPPSFLTQPPLDATVGQKFRYRAVAADQNGDVLSYDLTVKPDGMVVDAKTGLVSWLPTPDQMGVQNAVLRVNDGNGGVDLQSFAVGVSPPNALPIFLTGPGFGLPINPTAVVGQTWQYQPRISDADSDPLAFGLAGAPKGVKVDSATGLVTWTPKTDQAGNHSITVTVSDGQGEPIAQTFNIEVVANAPNSVPTITSAPRLNTGLGSPYLYNVQAIDPNGDPLTYTLATAPAGMTLDERGRIFWQPTSTQFGSNPVSIVVSDGRSGVAQQEFAINVRSQSINQPPSIESEPSNAATAQQQYQYNPIATDPDGDPLFWSLDAAPVGMSIDPETGKLRWKPSLEQVGTHEVAVRVMDSSGTYVGQAFTLNVRGVNVPPAIISTPPTVAAAGKPYSYAVLAPDPENDPVQFSLNHAPAGMSIDPNTGLIQWMPQLGQVGTQDVEILVTDASGGKAVQRYAAVVAETAANLPPAITSTPAFAAAVGNLYEYKVTATDPDGTISGYQLLKAPQGMVMDAEGKIAWNPTSLQLGTHEVVVGAVDNQGLGAAQGFTLIAKENSAPTIPNLSPQQEVTLGSTYRYDLKATDTPGDLLTFALVQYPNGMTIDQYGRISWTPSASDIGTNKPVEITVTDSFGSISTVAYNLSVVADAIPPKVNVSVSSPQVNIGESVTFTVNAVDNVKVESLGLTINGTPVILDAVGQATVKLSSLGNVSVVATAIDAAGHIETTSQIVSVIDPSDVNAPIVDINLDDDVEISAPLQIVGTISDSNLDYYILEVAPVGGGEFKEVYRNDNPVNVNNEVIATFDPTVLANDAYILRVTAVDYNNNASTTERVVNVAGDLKLGNFRLSFTDLSVPVSGIPITVTRSYDSFNAKSSDDFGYGWRLEFRDTDLRTSLKSDPVYEELGIHSVPFKDGTKVFITLPGGKRETFTFKPTPDRLNSYLAAAGPGGAMYHPAFKSQDGSTSTLTVKDAYLTRNGNEYYGVNGEPFNPVNAAFGGVYVLTTKEGIVYEIDANSGDLLTATDTNGNKLTFSDAGIKSSSDKEVTFGRDASGRIVNVVDPAGEKVEYEYDAKGDLVAVTNREDNKTQFKYEDEDRKHFLTEVIDPLGRSGVRTEYDDSGRLKQMIDASGSAVELVYDPDSSVQKVKDVFGKETTYVYDLRGNILTEIDPLGKRVDRTYDGDNNVLTETVITREVNSQGNSVEVKSTTEWTYDGSGNKLTEKDALGNVSRWSYNSRGQVLTETDALGNSTSYTYSPSGNLKSTKDAAGNVTKYEYDLRGNLLALTDAANNVTNFKYDGGGNVTSLEDSSGNKATYIYDSNGNMRRETMKIATPEGEKELVTEWTYNKEGKIESITQSGRTITYEYDDAGRQSASIDGNRRTEYRYNSQGKLVETIYPDETSNSNADNPRTITVYDKGGRQRATIDQNGRITHYKYDDAGRLTETIYPDETSNQIQQLLDAIYPGQTPQSIDWTNVVYPDSTPAYLASNSRTKTEYYKTGEVKAEIDVSGNRTEYEYDAVGRVSVTRFDANNYIRTTYDAVGNRKTETVFAEGISTTTTYDSKGQVTATTDPNGKTTQFEYDAKGQLKAVVDALKYRTEYTYDTAGNLTTVKDTNGSVTTYEYDEKGRRKAVIRPDNKRSTFVYDDVAKTVAITDFNNKTVKYSYGNDNSVVAKQYVNANNATVNVTYATNGLEETITDSRGATVYKYDSLGQVISRKDPTGPYLATGASIEYEYENGQVSKVTTPTRTTTYTYDSEGRLKTVSTPDMGTVTYIYDADGNLYQTEFPNNLVETRIYDNLGHLDLLKTAEVDPVTKQELQVISSYDYTVDNVGNRREVLENSGRKVEYKYDDLNRLLEEKVTNDPNGNNRVVGYTYDAVGNRLTKTDSVSGVTTYTYNNLNQLDFLTDNNVVTDYTYDDSGNLISEVTGSNSTVYRWENNGDNRLMGVTVNEGGVIRDVGYEYNAQGVRVGKVVDGVETSYLIDELQPYAQVLEEYDAVGNAKGSYVYGYDLLGKLEGSESSFSHSDGLGSTRVLTNGLGAVTNSYSYDAFGNLIVSTGGSNNAYLFAGEQRDGETGLDYLRARYYDPFLGRFVSADAYEGTLNDPMSLHDYQYAHANPVVNTDPSGYSTISDLLGTMAAYTVLAGLSYTTGSAVGTVAGGGSVWDAVAKYDQFFAGLTDALTFGISSEARRLAYGETATANHKGLFFNLGRLGGAIASMWIGANGTTFAEFSSASWVPRAALGYDIFGAGLGMAQSTINVAKGQATWWDILPFLPALTWFNIKYKVNVKGLGSNFGNLEISRRLSSALQDFRENTLRVARQRINKKVIGGTAGVGITDIPGFENRVFGGGSKEARINIGRFRETRFTSPNVFNKNHAEGDLVTQIADAIDASNLTQNDLIGKTIYMHIEASPCSSCIGGLGIDPKPQATGVIKQFSEEYPELTIIVTNQETPDVITIKNGIPL